MKNLKFKPLNFLYLVLAYFALASGVFGPSVELLATVAVVAFVGGTAMALSGFNLTGTLAAIQVEIWQNHVEQEIFKNNDFLRASHNADENVINSKVVHIPQSGGSGSVSKNRTFLPATVRKRTDTDVVYPLDEFTTDPVLIPHADTKELSYDKRQSVLSEDMDKLRQLIADWTLYGWTNTPATAGYGAAAIPAGQIINTTGSARVGVAPSATGNRLAYTRNDLQRMQTKFMQENRWFDGRMYALLSPTALAEMFPADNIVTATYMQNVTEEERRKGIIYKANGWNIMSRSSILVVKADGSVAAPGEAGVATDDEASAFWYQDAVEFAFGGVEAFERLKDPTFYGDIYSFLARTGSRARRSDFKGIALLKEAESA